MISPASTTVNFWRIGAFNVRNQVYSHTYNLATAQPSSYLTTIIYFRTSHPGCPTSGLLPVVTALKGISVAIPTNPLFRIDGSGIKLVISRQSKQFEITSELNL